ncbi:MAG: apolipoprotein N-acyltransferase, partial [Kiritimatiellae bacterium]|nr:apolipoprotein N-acyltransferase [Kiritimatiellia bacterium]
AWGYAGALGGWLGQLFWLTRVTWAGWVALSAYCALYALPMLAFAKKWRGGAVGFALGCAVLWVGGESFRGWFGGGFPWNPLGVAAAGCRPVAQWAEWGGASGIGLVAMAVNAAIAWVAGKGRISTQRRRGAEDAEGGKRFLGTDVLFFAGLAVGLCAGIYWGYGAGNVWMRKDWAESVRVAMVQPSIPQPDKWDEAKAEMIYGRLAALSGQALRGEPELVAWPEAAFPDQGEPSEDSLALVAAIAERAPVLTGYLGVDWRGPQDYDIANSAMLYLRGAAEGGERYDKRHLVICGEFVPVLCWMPKSVQEAVGHWTGAPLSLKAGKKSGQFSLPGKTWHLSPLICFEDILTDLAREDAQNGTAMLVNLTNDAWFDDVVAPRQHMRNAMLRAIETRLPLLRCANTGVTCLVHPSGKIEEFAVDGDTAAAGVMDIAVPFEPNPGQTFHTRHGELVGIFCRWVFTALLAAAGWRRWRRGRGD